MLGECPECGCDEFFVYEFIPHYIYKFNGRTANPSCPGGYEAECYNPKCSQPLRVYPRTGWITRRLTDGNKSLRIESPQTDAVAKRT